MSVTKEICEWLNTKAAKENLDLSTERDIFKAECDRLGSGYDAAQVELDALREELLRLEEEYDTLEHANITLKLNFAAAEQRNAELIELLRDSYPTMPCYNGALKSEIRDRIEAALKPTESGASE